MASRQRTTAWIQVARRALAERSTGRRYPGAVSEDRERQAGGTCHADHGSRFDLTLDYPPSARPGPRWGYDHPSNLLLREKLASHEQAYALSLDSIAGYVESLARIEPLACDPHDPSWINPFLPGLDAAALYAFLRSRQPRRYVEVGSGNSTKFAARAKRDGDLATTITSIDPAPRAEVNDLCDVVVREPLEATRLDLFSDLERGDIVFFDGSHRTFMNSDVTVFFLEVLPTLPAGTLVGIHDIYLPDDYPAAWTDRHYSEQYLLAVYLLADCAWLEPRLAAWYVAAHTALAGRLGALWSRPGLADVERHGGAFWIEITARSS
jgi:hypothetical protein